MVTTLMGFGGGGGGKKKLSYNVVKLNLVMLEMEMKAHSERDITGGVLGVCQSALKEYLGTVWSC